MINANDKNFLNLVSVGIWKCLVVVSINLIVVVEEEKVPLKIVLEKCITGVSDELLFWTTITYIKETNFIDSPDNKHPFILYAVDKLPLQLAS